MPCQDTLSWGRQETASLAVASFAQALLSWPLLYLIPCFSPSRSSSSGRSALTPCLLHPQGTRHPSVSTSASPNDSVPLFPPEGELFKCHDCVLGILGALGLITELIPDSLAPSPRRCFRVDEALTDHHGLSCLYQNCGGPKARPWARRRLWQCHRAFKRKNQQDLVSRVMWVEEQKRANI